METPVKLQLEEVIAVFLLGHLNLFSVRLDLVFGGLDAVVDF